MEEKNTEQHGPGSLKLKTKSRGLILSTQLHKREGKYDRRKEPLSFSLLFLSFFNATRHEGDFIKIYLFFHVF